MKILGLLAYIVAGALLYQGSVAGFAFAWGWPGRLFVLAVCWLPAALALLTGLALHGFQGSGRIALAVIASACAPTASTLLILWAVQLQDDFLAFSLAPVVSPSDCLSGFIFHAAVGTLAFATWRWSRVSEPNDAQQSRCTSCGKARMS